MKKPENKFTMRKCYLLICLLLAGALMTNRAYAQNVLDPDDPVINYDPNNPPQIPPYGTISKWVRTPRFSWNTDNYKAYFYKGIAFRLLFPPSYKSNPDKKYPLLLFLHGEGEKASIYDDELHLRNCARKIQDSVLKGSFDAFVLFPQTTYGGWAGSQFTTLYELINYMINNVQVDRYRIIVSGLSSGGDGTWNFTELYPKLVSACIPISAATANESQPGFINTIKTIPIWLSQGGKDNNPPPSFTDGVVENFRNAGIDIRTVEPRQAGIGLQSEGYYVTYPNNAHNTWDVHYAEPQAFQYMLRAYKSNPHVVSGRREFCPGTALNVHLELTPGFDAYEWSRNGVIIDGANTNTLTVTDTGTYAARIKDGGIWSDWSHWPAHITYKATTQTPPIQISGLMSGVIPAPDGNTSVKLEEPEGYASYEWRNSSGQIVGTNRIFTAGQPGKYVAEVTEVYGCSAHPSDSFYVVPSNGPNAPDPASDLTGYALSQTSIQLNWSNNLHPENNETAFEVYRSTQPGSGYALAAIVPADTLGYVDNDLMANTNYYYIVRAVNNTGAATPTSEIKVTTIADKLAPAAPGNLSVTGSNDNSIGLTWNSSEDNVSVTNYYIYINGVKSYATPDTLFQIYNLTAGQKYLFTIKAVDPSGNLSPSSNQVVASAINSGLTYKYYTGSWSTLPNLSTLIPVKSGFLKNISITPATQSTNYAFSFQGYINIIKPGTYTFYTNSDDGSNLYINNSRVVNNDGAHGTVEKSGTYTFNNPGRYPFRVDYFQGGGGASLSASWAATSLGIPKSAIPDSVFKVTEQAGNMPSRPVLTQTTAVSYHQINLHWTDNSNNETGFEIYRSTGNGSPWQIIATTAPDITAYEDTLVSPSTTYYYKVQAINKNGGSGYDMGSISGLNYSYYESPANLSTMPDFNSLQSVETGNVPNVTLSVKNRSSNYALKFEGWINIATAGNYTFYTKSDDGSILYIDGFDQDHIVVNNNYSQSPTERSGSITLSPGRHAIYITFFQGTGGDFLSASYAGPGISKQIIPDMVFANPKSYATTPGLPAAPIAPNNLKAEMINTTTVSLSWKDRSNNETAFRIYRSDGNNTNYRMLKELPKNDSLFINDGLYPNTTYYYKIEAVNIGGESGFSNEVSILTTPPQQVIYVNFNDGTNQAGGYWNNTNDPDPNYGDIFSSLKDSIGNITKIKLKIITPWTKEVKALNYGAVTGYNSGIYPDNVLKSYYMTYRNRPISIQVLGLDTAYRYSFTFLGNRQSYDHLISNYQIGNKLVKLNSASNTTNTVSINSIKPDSDSSVTFTFSADETSPYGYLNAMVISGGTSPSNQVPLQPTGLSISNKDNLINLNWTDQSNNENGFEIYRKTINSDTFSLVRIVPANTTTFYDSSVKPLTFYIYKIRAFNSKGFSLYSDTVQGSTSSMGTTQSYSNSIYINFNDGTNQAGGYWNNTNDPDPNYGDIFSSLKDSIGNITKIKLKIITPWTKEVKALNYGAVTGYNSGIYPDNVLKSYYMTYRSRPISIQVLGLDTAYRYSFTFLGNRQSYDHLISNYQIGNKLVKLNSASNTTNTVSINSIKPDSDSSVTFTFSADETSPYGYLNAMVINKVIILPPIPRNIRLSNMQSHSNNEIKISWEKEQSIIDTFKIYRSKQLNGPYTLLNPGVSNRSDTAYIDTNIEPVTKYYYYLVAVNKNGNSLPSDTVSITTLTTPPSIADIPDIYAGSGKITTVQISAAELNGATPSFSLQNYPSFMDFQDNHDGTATLTLHPSANDIGRYDSLKIIAVNEDGSTGSRYFKAFVTDDGLTNVIYMNFTDPSHPYRSPWNDLIYRNFTNHRFNNLGNSFGKTTNISVNIIQTWPGSQNYGVNTYNNSGVFPDSVMSSYYYINDNNSRTIQISGLDPNQKYNLLFFGSSTNGGNTNYTTIYAVNDQKDSVNNLRNSSKVIRFNGLTPDVSGNLTITVKKSASAYYGVLNAMVLEAYGSGTLISPSDLKATADTNSVVLRWQDRSYNESSLEIWRSTAINGPYSRINEVSANTTSYKDNTVSANTRYYYKIRAKISGGNPTLSAFSNIANVTTPQYAIYINFNEENPAPLPWNNTNTTPVEGQILYLLNSNRKNTGVILETGTGFSGVNPYGINTGNNSGIYPDNVISSTYWVDASDSGKLTIIGLNLSMSYNLTFFGSRAAGDDRTTIYLANGKKAALQVANNSSQAATISNVKPDENGSIHIEVTKGGNSPFGYIGSLIIQAHNNYDESGNLVSGPSDDMLARKLGMSSIAVETKKDSIKEDLFSVTNVYPNPFDQQINIKLKSPEKTKLILSLYDMMGRQIDLQQYDISEGVNTLQYRPRSGLMQGVYILSLRPVSAAKPVNVKLIKR